MLPSEIQESLKAVRGALVIEKIDVRTGKRAYEVYKNLMTIGHQQNYASFLAGVTQTPPSHIALGTGSDQEYATSNQDTDKALTSSGADEQLAQGFKVSATYTINSVYLWMKRIGTSPGELTLTIQTNAAGLPSGSSVTGGTSSTKAINGLETTYDWVRFAFPGSPSLVSATQYHLVLSSANYTYSAAVTEVIWGTDESAPAYADGVLETFDGATWTAHSPAADGVFRVNPNVTAAFNTVLGELDRNVISSALLQNPTTARLLGNFLASEAVDRLGAAGVFQAAVGGTLLATVNIDIKKTNNQILNVYWILSVN